MKVGDKIVSTCGSLYRGCEGVITEVHPPTDYSERAYSVSIDTPNIRGIACLFHRTQFVPIAAYLGRDHDRPCQECCCRMGGHTSEVMPL